MKKIFTLLVLLIICNSQNLFAQTFGNEWINYNQSYYKFKIYQDGVYRIPVASLTSAGLPSTVLGSQLQLFRDGEEQPILVSNSAGLVSTDYIEFYGTKANGNLDKRLHYDTSLHMNPTMNLTSDTAFYFITYNNTPNHLRYQSLANNLVSLPAKESYCLYTQQINYRNEFISGPSANEGQYQVPELLNLNLSQYQGEGYVKKSTTAKDSIIITCVNPYLDPSAPNAKLKTIVVGRSYNPAHTLKILANNIQLADTTYNRFDFFNLKRNVPMSMISGTNTFTFLYQPSGASNDKYGISNLELNYPVTFDFANTTSYSFELPAKNATSYIEITNFNTGGVAPILYDITNKKYLVGDIATAGIVKFLLPASANNTKFILQNQQSANLKTVSNLSSITFKNYSQSIHQGNYIIITDSRYTNDGAGNDNVNAYKLYRNSAAGGSYATTVAYTSDIYNEFGYGYEFSSLSMKNFLHYAYASPSWINKPKHTLIIGKGLEYQAYLSYKAASSVSYPFYAVPTFGQPGSDLLLTDFNNNDKPLISIGRLSLFNGGDIKTYLDKLKDHEASINSTTQTSDAKLWQKRVLQIAGIEDSLQSLPIISAIDRQKLSIESPYFGANVMNVYKSRNPEQESINNTRIDSFINNGTSVVQFFGHSSASTIDYGLDFPEKYTNYKKYPYIIANGCGAGNIFLFTGQKYLSERFLLTPNAGAIGFLASVNTGFTGYLGFYTDSLYGRMARSMYTNSIGEQLINNVSSLISLPNFQNDFLFKMHTEQINLNGDPAIKLAKSTLPDYAIELNDVVITPKDLSLALDSIDVEITFHSLGKFTTDSVELVVKRTLSDNSVHTAFYQKVPGFTYSKTINVRIPVLGEIGKGTNQLIISVDRNNEVVEISESNNVVTKVFAIRSSGIKPVYPSEFSIVASQPVTLKASTLNPFEELLTYKFELDTTAKFTSPIKTSGTVVSEGGVVKWQPTFTFSDSVVYYWRTAIDDGLGNWETSSFIYINQSIPGWNQSHYFQFQKDNFDGISLDSNSRSLTYTGTSKLLQVQNVCMNGAVPYNYIWPEYLVKMNGSTLYTFGCDPYPGYSSLQFIVIDTLTGEPWLNKRPDPNVAMGRFGSFDPCRISAGTEKVDPFFEFSFLSANSRKGIMDFLDSIPSGYYVMIQTRLCVGSGCGTVNSTFVRHWMSDTATMGSGVSLYHKLKNMGLTNVDSFTKNRPMIWWTKKNQPETVKQYMGADATVKLYGEFDYTIKRENALLQSTIIGPASNWTDFKRSLFTYDLTSSDINSFNIYGITSSNKKTLISTVVNDTSLSFIDAHIFPYLQLELNTSDATHRTPTQMKYWRVYYTPLPEAALNPASMYNVTNGNTPETKIITVAIENLTNVNMDSMLVSFTIYDRYNVPITTITQKYKPLPAGDTIQISYELNTTDLFSNMKFGIEVNPDNDQMELYHPNNIGVRSMSIIDPALPLPVTLQQFTVTEEDCNTKIYWTTNDEVNFSHFDIERKKEKGFEKIASINANSNVEATKVYTYTDEKPTPAVYQYRLKMVDIDAKYQYSIDKALRLNCNENSDIQLYPNPTNQSTNLLLTCENEQSYDIKMVNAIGQQVYFNHIDMFNETKIISIPVEHLAAGIYSVIISDTYSTKAIKFTKQ